MKWFFNKSPSPVYQWIHNQKPQGLGVLKGRLWLDYRATENNATAHRALYIVNPTVELSGEYKCTVSTNLDEDFSIKKMIVWGKCVAYTFFQFVEFFSAAYSTRFPLCVLLYIAYSVVIKQLEFKVLKGLHYKI